MDTHPEKLVPGSEGWPPPGPEGDLELLPEEEIFEKQVMPAAKSLGMTASKSLRSSSIR